MRVRVLGPVEVADERGPVSLGSRSQRLVLGVLASRPGETVSADALIDALWGDDPPRTAAHTMRTYVSRLRNLLGGAVASAPGGYALTLVEDQLDATRFEALTNEAARAGDPGREVALLDEALALWRGEPFGDLADAPPLRGPASRLAELRRATAEARAGALLRAGRTAEAVAAAEALVAEDPLREGVWAVLVEALAAAGRTRDALAAYQRAAAALAEAGLVPSERLRSAEAAALAGPVAPPVLAEARRLPVSASSLVGRDGDLAALDELLAGCRLVTLCGPGGVGKTRLALALAARVAGRHRFGARLVTLAALDDPSALIGAVVDELGLSTEDGPPETALARAGALDLLIVLDNCEHLVAEAARAAEIVTTGGGAARVVATSRERLGVDGEQVWAVAPLGLGDRDDATAPAVTLFLERARAARPDLRTGPAELQAAARISRRLDGLPLALEMAAARAASLPLPELADRLDHLDLGELTSARRSVEPRHRTMAAVVEWSEALLDEADRSFLAELSVFAGPVHAADVASVTGRADPTDTLARLAERSLLVADVTGPRARYGMLDTIRRHAHHRLGATGRAAVLARRHAEHVTAAAAEADAALGTAGESDAAGRLDALVDEMRAAHRFARGSDPDLAGRLSAAVHPFASSRLRDEPLAWATELAADTPHPAALASAALRRLRAGDLDAALTGAEAAVAAASARRDRAARIMALDVLSDVHLFAGRLQACADASGELLADAEAAADPHQLVLAYLNLALAAAYAGRVDEAEVYWSRSVESDPPSPSDQGWVAFLEGEVVLDRDPPRALAALGRAVVLADSVRNHFLGGVARISAGSLQARVGEPAAALAAFAGVIEYWRRRGAQHQQLTTLRNLVVLLDRVGLAPEAALLLGAVEHHAAAPAYGDEAGRLAAVTARLVKLMGQARVDAQLSAGTRLSLDEAAQLALTWLPAAATAG
jgi:predicted ATPase/DNA-binding SARP family transcriptional activator